MAVASLCLERYAAIVALPACALGSAAAADIIYTEVNEWIYNETIDFTMAGASVRISADNWNTFSSKRNIMDAIVHGGAIALNGGSSAFGDFPEAEGFAAGEEIGAGANFGGSSSWANLAATFSDSKYNLDAGGDWQAFIDETELHAERRLFLGVKIANGSDVNYGWIDITWEGDFEHGATIHGYAYESDVNTAIVAGATESAAVVPGAPTAVGLMGLAAGAAGIRRKRSA
ncbi:MAG: hypothetical protein VX672_01005 [Planctomycetota bacterium]|nr:hypothetical protein [Planctomycetota bacterium]